MDLASTSLHDVRPWAACGSDSFSQITMIHPYNTRTEAIQWAHTYHNTRRHNNTYQKYRGIIIQRTDIDPNLCTPNDIQLLAGYYPINGEYQYFKTPHVNNAPLDTCVRPNIHDMRIAEAHPDNTRTIEIQWQHPLPSIFPFFLSFCRTYLQCITPSTITLTSADPMDTIIEWKGTYPGIKNTTDLLDLLDTIGYKGTYPGIKNTADLLDLLHRSLMECDNISQHERIQCLRQLPYLIDPDIGNIIEPEYILD